MNIEAATYYRLTEDSYRSLELYTTPFMNLGLWPAASILDAQRQLVLQTLTIGRQTLSLDSTNVACILELGPGWGGSRPIIAQEFPSASYIAVNCSVRQIRQAEKLNAAVADTTYVHGFMEDLTQLSLPNPDLVLGVESVLHVKDKERLFKDLHIIGTRSVLLAEICAEDRSAVLAEPLFRPSLVNTRSVADYSRALTSSGFATPSILDISSQVFDGYAEALHSVHEASFAGNKRILRQFRQSYDHLAKLANNGSVRYVIIAAERNHGA